MPLVGVIICYAFAVIIAIAGCVIHTHLQMYISKKKLIFASLINLSAGMFLNC